MELFSFRGFSPISAPCLFINPIDQTIIYPYAKFIVLEKNKEQFFFRGHKGNITSMDMSSKGRMIASGDSNIYSDVLVWNFVKRELLFTLSEHDKGITSIGFSKDERLLATTGNDNRLIIWDMATGNIVTHKNCKIVSCLKWGGRVPDIKNRPTTTFYLATFGLEGIILHIIDPSQGKITSNILPLGKYTRTITSFAFNETHLLCSTTSSDLLIFELHSQTLVKVIPTGKSGISYLYSDENDSIIASCLDGSIHNVNENSSQQISKINNPICSISNGYLLTKNGILQNNQNKILWESHSTEITSIDTNGNVGVSASIDKTIRVWDNRNLNSTFTFNCSQRSIPRTISLSTSLLTIGFDDGLISGFDFTNGERLFDINHSHHSSITALEIAPTRRFFASGGFDTAIKLWDVRTRDMLTLFQFHKAPISSLAFMSTSTHFYSSSLDNSVCFLDVSQEKLIERITTFESGVRDIDIFEDFLITITQDGHLSKYCISQSTKPLISNKINEGNTITISLDGNYIIVGHINGEISLFDFNTLQKISSMPVHSNSVIDMRTNKDGKIFSAGIDGGLSLIKII